MSISAEQLNHLATLAYLDIHPETAQTLVKDINAMMDFVDLLRLVDTTDIQPLMHPVDMTQPLRADIAQPCNLGEALGAIAPQFVDNLYLVPKVIK